MEFKLCDLLESYDTLNELKDKSFPFKLSFAIAMNISKMKDIAAATEENRMKIIERYAKRDDEGNIIHNENSVKIDDVSSFSEEYNSYLEETIDVEVISVNSEAMEKLDKEEKYDTLSPAQIIGLSFMIAE